MKKLLVVDDEKAMREMIKVVFGSGKFKLLEAENGNQALEIAQDEIPDVILLDVMMPGLDGFEVCHRIKTDPVLSKCIVVMVTAKSHQKDKENGLDSGADYYITKPFSTKALVMVVMGLINGIEW